MIHPYPKCIKWLFHYGKCEHMQLGKTTFRKNAAELHILVRYYRTHSVLNNSSTLITTESIISNSNSINSRGTSSRDVSSRDVSSRDVSSNTSHNVYVNNSTINKEERFRKIIVIPFDKNKVKMKYNNIPFDFEQLNEKSKKEILTIYKIIRDKEKLQKLPNDFMENLFECTKKYVRSLLPYEFVRIYKTVNIVKKKDKQLNLLLNQQMKRIYHNFDVTSISKLFQIFTFTKSKPTNLIKKLSETVLTNFHDCKSWHIRELISIFSFFEIDKSTKKINENENGNTSQYVDYVYTTCLPTIIKNIKQYTPKDITIVFYSYTKLNKQNNILQNVVAKHVVQHINDYQFYQLAIIINCFAKTGEKNQKLCQAICNKVKQKMTQQQTHRLQSKENKQTENKDALMKKEKVDMKNVVQGVTEIGNDVSTELTRQNEAEKRKKQTERTKQEKRTILREQTIKRNNGTNIMENDTSVELQMLKPKDVSLILNALVRLEYYDDETFNSLIPFIINEVSQFSPQSLSNIVHAYSKVQITNTLLLDRLISASIKNIHKFKNKEISNLANSLIRLNRKDKMFFTYVIDEFLYRATIGSQFLNYNFDILSLQQLAYSFSKAGLCDERVFFILHKQLVKKINQIQKKEKKGKEKLGETKNGGEIALRNRDDVYVPNENCKEKNMFDYFALATFINSYAKGNISQNKLKYFVSYMIRKKRKEKEALTNQSLTNIVYGLLQLQIKDKKLYQILLKESKERVQYLQPTQIIILLYSFSKLRIYSKNFVKKSIQILNANINYLNISDLSLACYALSNFLYRDLIFCYKITKIILLGNFEVSAKHVSQLFNSLTKLCFNYKPFYDYIFQKIIYYLHEFNEKELVNIVYSFIYYFHMTILNYHSSKKLSAETQLKMQHINITENENYTQNAKHHMNMHSNNNSDDEHYYCYYYNDKQPDPMNEILFFKNELNIFYNLIYILNEKYRNKLSLISIYQLQTVDLYLRAFFKNYKHFPIFLKVFFIKCRRYKLKIEDYLILSSKTHRNISKYLNLVGISHRSEVQFGPYQLDIVVDFVKNKTKQKVYTNGLMKNETQTEPSETVIENLVHKNIVIEVDGVSHFYKESFSRTLNSIIKHFVLQKFGWQIIHIPYQEWNQCFNFKKKIKYCLNIWNSIVNLSDHNISVGDFLQAMNQKDKQKSQERVAETKGKGQQIEIEIGIKNNEEKTINEEKEKEKEKKEINGDTNNCALYEMQKGSNINNTADSLPEFYKISQETLFLNQRKDKNTRQRHTQNLKQKS